jgi:hypothetical protein
MRRASFASIAALFSAARDLRFAAALQRERHGVHVDQE